MKMILITSIIGIIMALATYYLFTTQSIRFKRRWREMFNKEHPTIKNPYIQVHSILFPIGILLFLISLGWALDYVSTLEDSQPICIQTIQEYPIVSGLITSTTFHAYINNEYDVIFDRPQQYKQGDCFVIYKYKYIGSWALHTIED